MALARGKYGIEYNPHPVDEDSSLAGWVILLVVLAALVLLVVAAVRRYRAVPDEPAGTPAAEAAPPAPPAVTNSVPEPMPSETAKRIVSAVRDRPRDAKNLLLKLERAEAARDIELAATTIEQLRAQPGGAVADLDDSLARRLGELNFRRLFEGRSRQWVSEVAVRRGDSATRIAFEHGSTLASLLKLNALPSADRLRVGQRLQVMDHPKPSLVVHRAMMVADLSLKGRFFKRYDIIAPVRVTEGRYETPAKLRAFWSEKGLAFSPADRAELELLLPPKTPVIVSEL